MTARPSRDAVIALGAAAGVAIAVAFLLFAWADLVAPEKSPALPRGQNFQVASTAVQNPSAPSGANHATDYETLLASLRKQITAGANGLALLKKVADSQPATAIELALALAGSDDEQDGWVTDLTRTWAERDPQAAWDWLGRQTWRMEQLANGSLIGVVLDRMAARAPDLVVKNADALLRRGETPDAIPALVTCQLGLTALIAHGALDVARAAVEDWARNPRAFEVGASAYNVVAGAIGQTSWTDAGDWLASLPPSHDRSAAFATLASRWGDQDPAAALTWAESLGAQNEPFAAVRSVFSEWAERDTSKAGDWLLSYIDRAQSETEIDQLIGSFVTFSPGLKRDPKLALFWAGMTRETTQRETLLERVTLRWGRSDFAAATNYVDTLNDWTAAQKQSLKQKLLAQAGDTEPLDD